MKIKIRDLDSEFCLFLAKTRIIILIKKINLILFTTQISFLESQSMKIIVRQLKIVVAENSNLFCNRAAALKFKQNL